MNDETEIQATPLYLIALAIYCQALDHVLSTILMITQVMEP